MMFKLKVKQLKKKLAKTAFGDCSNQDRYKIISKVDLKVLVENPFLDIVFYNLHHSLTSQSRY